MKRKLYSKRRSSRRRGGLGVNLSLPFLVGAVVGVTNLDDKIPKDLTLIAATAPVTGLGVVKSGAQGVILGNVVQTLTGFRVDSRAASDSSVLTAFGGF